MPIYDDGAQEPVSPPFGSGAQEPVNPFPSPTSTGTNTNGILPPTAPQGTANPAGGFDWSQFLSGLGGQGLSLASLIPALATAFQQYDNAGQYGDLGREAAAMASPVSLEERRRQQDRLNQYYDDPTAFLEGNPEYMANMRLGSAQLARKNNARGLGGSGAATQDQLRFLTDLSSRYVGQERKDLMHMGGYQFDPGNAASMLMRGGEAEIKAKNAALAALLYPFGPGAAGNPNGGGGPNGGGNPIQDLIRRLTGGGRTNPNNMNGGLGNAVNSLSGLFGIANGFGPGLAETYGNTAHEGWNYMPEGWADRLLGTVGGNQGGPNLEDLYGDVGGGNWDFNNINWDTFNFDNFWANGGDTSWIYGSSWGE